jgi:hypothetical protein
MKLNDENPNVSPKFMISVVGIIFIGIALTWVLAAHVSPFKAIRMVLAAIGLVYLIART